MNTANTLFRPALLACAAAGWAAASRSASAQDFEEPAEKGYYFRLGPSALFGVKASITGARPVLPAGRYDDGFVLPDAGTPANPPPDTLTWNWGYSSSSQNQNNQLTLNRYNGIPTIGEKSLDVGSPLFRGEVVAGIHLWEFEMFGKRARIGAELGYGLTGFSSRMNFTSVGGASYTTAVFDTTGVVLPNGPYAGTPQGPGPLIPLHPLTTPVPALGTGTTVFDGKLEAALHQIRLGPALDLELNGRLNFGFGMGYSSIFANPTLRYSESTTFDTLAIPAYATTGDINKAKWTPGVYAELRVAYKINKHLSAYLGADAAYHKDVTFGDAYHEVKIKLGGTYGLKAGIGYSF